MQCCFQYYVLFTNHTQFRAREHNNTMQKLILNYTRLHEHTHLIHVMGTSYVRTHIYIEAMCTKKVNECAVSSERSVLVKIANGNVMPALRGFRWYPYFVAQE